MLAKIRELFWSLLRCGCSKKEEDVVKTHETKESDSDHYPAFLPQEPDDEGSIAIKPLPSPSAEPARPAMPPTPPPSRPKYSCPTGFAFVASLCAVGALIVICVLGRVGVFEGITYAFGIALVFFATLARATAEHNEFESASSRSV